MALTKQLTFKGFPTQAYAKITSFTVYDYMEENVKRYGTQITVTTYTDSTKQYDVEGVTVPAQDFEATPSLAELYSKIKATEKFDEWTDV